MKNVISSGKLEEKWNRFTDKQKNIITDNTVIIQVTYDCNTGCNDCCFGARKGVSDFIPYNFIDEITSKYRDGLRNIAAPYFANDFCDYYDSSAQKNWLNLFNTMKKNLGKNIFISTSIPKGLEKSIFELLINERNLSKSHTIDRMSISKFNYNRLKSSFEREEYVQNQSKRFGIYIVELPNGDTLRSIKDKVSFDDFLNYLRKETFIDIFRKSYLFEVFNFLNGDFRREVVENGQIERSLLGVHGVLINPKGVFNIRAVQPSRESPYGFVLEEIFPDSFEVISRTSVGSFSSLEEFIYSGDRKRIKG